MSKSFNARAWLRYAREDLDAAEILLRAGFYRHALFWAEQASEKTLKVFIIEVHHLQDMVSRLRGLNERLYNILKHFTDPKTFGHICKERELNKLMEFCNEYPKLISHVSSTLTSAVKERMSNKRYREVFKDVEMLIGEAVKSVESLTPSCKEFNASCIVRVLKDVEKRAERVRNIISSVVEEVLRRYGGNELAEQAIKDVHHVYTCFVDALASATYLELHAYLCRFFEASRYPGIMDIPRDFEELLPQIVELLRKNLERVQRLIEHGC